MRIGPLARSQTNFMTLLAAAAAAATAFLPMATFGQAGNAPFNLRRALTGHSATQALYTAPSDDDSGSSRAQNVDAYGNPMIVPAGYCEQGGECGDTCQPCDGCAPCGGCAPCNGCGPCSGGCMRDGGFMGPCPMGAGGTDPPVGYDLMDDAGMQGDFVDQRGPHYFDVRAEAVFLQRDTTFGRDIPISVAGQSTNIVLATGQLDYGIQPGFRVVGRYDICPLSVVEFGYTGIFDFNSSATTQDPNGRLFSLFSDLGDPTSFTGSTPVTTNGGPAPQTERAFQHSISLESDLQSAEISYRRYWLGYLPRVSGTMLAGFRYTKLDEEFDFNSLGETTPATHPVNLAFPINGLDYTVSAENNLAGFQTGADMWLCLSQGLRIGVEGKAGLYDNHYVLQTRSVSTVTTNGIVTQGAAGPPNLFEQSRKDQPAFLGEASVDLVADLLPSLSLRGGYEVLYINSIVLAGDNFNTGSPYNPNIVDNGQGPQRTPFVADQSEALYHGAHVGIEYVW